MAKLFNFNDLKTYTRISKCSVDEIAANVGISYDGLKRGLQNESLSLRFVVPLCEQLHITPNGFFGVETQSAGDTVYGDQQKGAKKQIIYKESEELKQTIQMLRDQLKAKDEQIAAKDQQINKLLGL